MQNSGYEICHNLISRTHRFATTARLSDAALIAPIGRNAGSCDAKPPAVYGAVTRLLAHWSRFLDPASQNNG